MVDKLFFGKISKFLVHFFIFTESVYVSSVQKAVIINNNLHFIKPEYTHYEIETDSSVHYEV